MRAIVHNGAGGPEVLEIRTVPDPMPGPAEIRIRVRAAGLNRADIIQRRGGYPAPPGWPADIPGLEYAGEVETAGPGVTRWTAGDRVMGLVGGGGHAEMVVVHEDEALAVPTGMPLEMAAAIPEAFLTAFDALVVRARLVAGERVLIHAVGSGVGTAAVQLVRRLGGTSIGTSRTRAKLAAAAELGLGQGIDTGSGGFGSALTAPVDVILDFFGAGALAENLAALAPRGRLVLLGTLQGGRAEGVDVGRVLRSRLELIGSVMRSRGRAERVPLVRRFAADVLSGFRPDVPDRLTPVVGATIPLTDAAGAHGLMERNEVFGKIVLTLG